MKQKLVIAHLYPREMNIYGDAGNVLTLVKRLEWRGYEAEVRAVEMGEPFDFSQVDIVFGGGGQDRGQLIVGQDLLDRGDDLRQVADDGLPMLLVCGLYQLFGRSFTTADGQELPGLGIFRATTTGGDERMIGNIVVASPFGRLVGFENHSGVTLLESGQKPLGRVLKGYGNDPKAKYEGAVSHNTIGTYLHGPILPKNPALADHLLLTALKRRHNITELAPLDDRLEHATARVAAQRPQ
jgi:CobQ-like glutamine amidotransferase family enzyme